MTEGAGVNPAGIARTPILRRITKDLDGKVRKRKKRKNIMNPLEELLGGGRHSGSTDRSEDPNIGNKLRASLEVFQKSNQFQVGDVVNYKPGMNTRAHCGPFIVMDALEEPVFDSANDGAGTMYFREPLDIVVGLMLENLGTEGEDTFFAHSILDSRRLEIFKED